MSYESKLDHILIILNQRLDLILVLSYNSSLIIYNSKLLGYFLFKLYGKVYLYRPN